MESSAPEFDMGNNKQYNLEILVCGMIRKIEERHPNATLSFKAKKLEVTDAEYLKLYHKAFPPQELNIAQEEKRLIQKAFQMYPQKSVLFIAKQVLKISPRNLYRKVKQYDIYGILDRNYLKYEMVVDTDSEEYNKNNYNWPKEEKRIIEKALTLHCDKSYAQIAQMLGITERNLYDKVNRYGMQYIKSNLRKEKNIKFVRVKRRDAKK